MSRERREGEQGVLEVRKACVFGEQNWGGREADIWGRRTSGAVETFPPNLLELVGWGAAPKSAGGMVNPLRNCLSQR